MEAREGKVDYYEDTGTAHGAERRCDESQGGDQIGSNEEKAS